jgi:hypothetical protein
MNLHAPKPQQTYTLREIWEELALLDSPSLQTPVRLPDGGIDRSPIQDAHLRVEELLSVPGMAESRWTYQYTTKEWIPVFHFVGEPEDAAKLVDIEPFIDAPGEHWLTPKGFPREQ